MEHLFTAEGLVSLVTLTFLEIVLGIDNVVFISILTGKLPIEQQGRARLIGIGLALIARIALLLGVSWLIGLQKPVLTLGAFALSYRDLILFAGGLFLIGKSVSEIHGKLEGTATSSAKNKVITFRSAVVQIILIDLIFSLDSILTAIGLVENVLIIIIAVVISLGIMLFFSRIISDFINKHPTMKLLALAFLIMIGTLLVVEGLHVHVPRGYIYFAMAFALGIEFLNMKIRKKTTPAPVSLREEVTLPKVTAQNTIRKGWSEKFAQEDVEADDTV
ncbi:TerC family protein [Dawidia soli]|uniref:TerC family protein n=1 Tax=Dawidia soli TaxID=2782352 RepID=A0AAP2DFP9_9BACT|nr:TerC family protein [Dawidia soli]MBT1690251.1 TerC family protein [Dawidia soli]